MEAEYSKLPEESRTAESRSIKAELDYYFEKKLASFEKAMASVYEKNPSSDWVFPSWWLQQCGMEDSKERNREMKGKVEMTESERNKNLTKSLKRSRC